MTKELKSFGPITSLGRPNGFSIYLIICALSVNPSGGGREMEIHGEIVLLSILQVEPRPFSTWWNNVLLHLAFPLVFSFVVLKMEPCLVEQMLASDSLLWGGKKSRAAEPGSTCYRFREYRPNL